MKLNKKFVAINVLATLLITEGAMAKVTSTRSQKSGDTKSSSSAGNDGPIKQSVAEKSTGTTTEGALVEECDGNTDKEIYYPMEVITAMARDEGAKVDISFKGDNSVVVKIPAVANICGNFVPVIRQDKVTKNITLLMTIKKENPETKKLENVTNAQLEKCIQDSGKTKDGHLDHAQLTGRDYSSSVREINYEYNKAKDVQKSIVLTYGSPSSFYTESEDGYKHVFDQDDKIKTVPGMSCMSVERVAKGVTYAHQGRDAILQEINELCKNGTAQAIADARNTLGNADALKDIAEQIKAEMDAGYLSKVKIDVDKIYKELTGIEDKVLKNKDDMTEEAAKNLVNAYADKLKELNEIYLHKAIQRVDVLMQQREKLEDDSAEAKAIDQEIKGLNKGIAEFSGRGAGLTYLYDVMAKFALVDSGKTIEDIYLKSKFYSQVYSGNSDGRPKALSFEQAHKKQVEGMKKFEDVGAEWNDIYLVGKGNQFPAIKTQKEAQAVATRMNSRLANFQKKEAEDYNKYCTAGMLGGMKNQTKCKEYFNGKNKREAAQLKKREKDLKYIAAKERKLSKMTSSYNDHLSRQTASTERDDERYDSSSISGYEDDFSERFPGYSGNTSTAYDPSMYNMGGNQNMMMGQQQMYQPQMMNQGYQQQPMMGNQLQSGWPAMQ
jgi:hypothetical protein